MPVTQNLCRFMQLAEKFNVQKDNLRNYLTDEANMKHGSAKNLTNSLWKNHQPKRELTHLARYLSKVIPYNIDAVTIEDFLAGEPKGAFADSYEEKTRRLEGLYLQLRLHSSNQKLVLEYLALKNGEIGYLSYVMDAHPRVYRGPLRVDGKHLYFRSVDESPYSEINGICETRDGSSRYYPAMLMGLDDFREEMVSCCSLITKIRSNVQNCLDFGEFVPSLYDEGGVQARRFKRHHANSLIQSQAYSAKTLASR